MNEPVGSNAILQGQALCQAGRWGEAITFLRERVKWEEGNSALWELLGIAYLKTGAPAEAVECLVRAAQITPESPILSNLGAALLDVGRFEESLAASRQALALALSRDNLSARHNAAKALIKLGRAAEAEQETGAVLERNPSHAGAWATMGVARQARGVSAGAVEAFARSLVLKPTTGAQSQLLFAMHEAGLPAAEILRAARRWDGIHGKAAGPMPARSFVAGGGRRLRVGYVSGDFKKHPVATFFMPLLAAHHADVVEVFCYSHVMQPDRMTEALRKLAPNWRDVSRLSDEAAAAVIRADQIDLLVDLAGHCPGNRLGIFAERAAGVQMTYLGYPGTTGLSSIGWRLTDGRVDPVGMTEGFYSEKLVRVEGTFAAYGVPDTAPAVSELPMKSGGACQFASFNARSKINDGVLVAWARILSRVPGSRLNLYAFPEEEMGAVRQRFASHGVSPERIAALPRLEVQDYFAAHGKIDILLDTFPLSGHTVICHGLWMGVPSVCVRGGSCWERLGASVMECVGLGEFVAASVDAYVNIAATRAEDVAGLGALRAGMRERMAGSALMDYEGHARRVEAAMGGILNFEC